MEEQEKFIRDRLDDNNAMVRTFFKWKNEDSICWGSLGEAYVLQWKSKNRFLWHLWEEACLKKPWMNTGC